MPRCTVKTPVGPVTVIEEDGALVRVTWEKAAYGPEDPETSLLREAKIQLEDYFAGRRRDFDLPCQPAGSDFQQRVWQEMRRIPAGETLTYGEIAAKAGGVAQAVGGACGANPIPIVIPCHRVVAAGAKLGGFSGGGGPDTKRRLLELEGALPPSLL